jgi:phage-related protein
LDTASLASGSAVHRRSRIGPLTGLGSGVMELALRHSGDAFRVVYALQVGSDVWVVHAFLKKSKTGIATPRQEIHPVRERLRRLQEIFG